jgi:hypothetical protein
MFLKTEYFQLYKRLIDKSLAKKHIYALIAGLLFFWPSIVMAFGLGLTPTTVEMEIKPGGQYRQVIKVGNVSSEKPLALTVGLADWTLDENGQLILSPPASTANSASDWLRFSPASFRLKPGELKQIIVDAQIPVTVKDAGDYRTALLVSTLLPPLESREEVSGVWSRYQVASLFYLTLMPAQAEPIITTAELEWSEQGTPRAVCSIHNSGNSHARLKGELRLLDEAGKTVHAQSVNVVVLEQQTRHIKTDLAVPWDSLPSGRYTLEFALETDAGSVPVADFSKPILELPLQPPARSP